MTAIIDYYVRQSRNGNCIVTVSFEHFSIIFPEDYVSARLRTTAIECHNGCFNIQRTNHGVRLIPMYSRSSGGKAKPPLIYKHIYV